MPELLSPAGNMEKMKTAILYGADAVYLAGHDFGMRAAADNFSLSELREAVLYAHAHRVRVYVTINIMPHWDEIAALETYLQQLGDLSEVPDAYGNRYPAEEAIRPDALIVADLGVFSLVRSLLPDMPIHISTQAGVVSHTDANAWHRLGASRVVLARELTFAEIQAIRARTDPALALEAFVHGSMCVSYSGRCLLSAHLTGRDANHGQCTQPCRWNYRLYEIEEEKRPDQRMEIRETDRGVFIMSSRDLCTIEYIPQLIASGITSFKIEGRMKSAYYTAVTTNAYRMAMDAYWRNPTQYHCDPTWKRELESVSHRLYAPGYYCEKPMENPQLCTDGAHSDQEKLQMNRSGYIREKAYIATALSYDSTTHRALFVQRNKACEGDKVELISPGKVGRPFVLKGLQNEEGAAIASVPHPGMRFSVDVPFEIRTGDILRGGQ